MKLKEARSAVDWIRDTKPSDIVVVSLFLLPLLLGAWSVVLNSISYLDEHDGFSAVLLCLLLLTYVVGIVVMKATEGRDDQLRRAKTHIRNRLQQRGNQTGSFDYLRRTVDETYTDEFLRNIIDQFPLEFRRARIKGGKDGMALVEETEED
jgi:hypothetical protein